MLIETSCQNITGVKDHKKCVNKSKKNGVVLKGSWRRTMKDKSHYNPTVIAECALASCILS